MHLDPEGLVVVRPGLLHDPVLRVGLHALLHVLLEKGLVVLGVPVLEDLVDLGDEHLVHEPLRGGETGVQVVRADDRLEAVGEDGLLRPPARVLLALADEDEVVHAQAAGDLREARLAHDEALDPRQLPFRLVRQGRVEVLATTRPSTESPRNSSRSLFSPFSPARGEGAVRECLVEELQLAEPDARVPLEELELLLPFRLQRDELAHVCFS